jgi:hypothetical protein
MCQTLSESIIFTLPYSFNKKLIDAMKAIVLIISILCISLPESRAQTEWTFELHGGGVYNLPMPLKIRQNGHPDIKLTARYNSESFVLPVYWDWRLSRWNNEKAWELEVIHHKLYLSNTTSEVQKFSISHGFNMIFLNRGIDKTNFNYRYGIGLALIHPESKIRNLEFGDSNNDIDMGYYISGPIINLAIGKNYRLSKRFYLNGEAKTTLAWASVRIAEGNADVYNIAFHIILGVGYKISMPKMPLIP